MPYSSKDPRIPGRWPKHPFSRGSLVKQGLSLVKWVLCQRPHFTSSLSGILLRPLVSLDRPRSPPPLPVKETNLLCGQPDPHEPCSQDFPFKYLRVCCSGKILHVAHSVFVCEAMRVPAIQLSLQAIHQLVMEVMNLWHNAPQLRLLACLRVLQDFVAAQLGKEQIQLEVGHPCMVDLFGLAACPCPDSHTTQRQTKAAELKWPTRQASSIVGSARPVQTTCMLLTLETETFRQFPTQGQACALEGKLRICRKRLMAIPNPRLQPPPKSPRRSLGCQP